VMLSDGQIRSIRGKSKQEAILELLGGHVPSADSQRIATEIFRGFQRILMQRYETQGVAPMDGADETFEWLRMRDVKIALNTGFDRALTALLLRLVGWDKSIEAVICHEDVPRGRPAPYLVFRAMEQTGCDCVHRVAVVGDTVSDLQAAHNAGARWRIGVLTGAHGQAQLKSGPYSHILPSVKELPSVFDP
jgi:phosphonatase-like hydrolase